MFQKTYRSIGARMLLRVGLVLERAWKRHAVDELEVEENVSHMANNLWSGECLWMEKWNKEQQKAWTTQIFEEKTNRQVRGLAGKAMREIRDLGIKWPRWHTLLFEQEKRWTWEWFARRT